MPKFAANLSMLFGEAPFLDRFALAADAGFKGVEYLFPYDFEAADLRRRLNENGLVQVLHNLPAGDWAAGERGVAALPGREDEFREGVERAIRYATTLGCVQVNCLAGIAPEGGEARRVFVENIRFAAGELERVGIRLLIEPINHHDIPGFFLNRVDQAAGIIAEVGSSNLFIQYDFYHQQRTGGELMGTFLKFQDRIAHVQIAGNPGRNEPDTGEVNYAHVFRALDAAGYDGWIGCEYKPAGATRDGLGWLKALAA